MMEGNRVINASNVSDVTSGSVLETVVIYSTTAVMTSGQAGTQISWDNLVIVYSVFGIGLVLVVSVVGIFANAIVMAVFYRQGVMNESSTVSLFTLAATDFLVQLTHILNACADILWLLESEGIIGLQDVNPGVVFVIGLRAKYPLNHIICWLTAYLSFERCFSVMFPFKVKRIFSPRNSVIAVLCIYAGSIITFMPIITRYTIVSTIVNNKTRVDTVENSVFSEEVREWAVILNPVTLRPLGIVIVVVSNLLILVKVKSSKKWRETVSSSSIKENTTDDAGQKNKSAFQKEEKLIKMISIISSIFLICTIPDMFIVLFTQTTTVLRLDWTVQFALYAVSYFTESVNSAINIFVYYFMSTNFKKEYRRLFKLTDKK